MFDFLVTGPLASALTNRYGCRKVTVVGAVIASLGFMLSLFAPNIYYLYFSFGILSGKYVIMQCRKKNLLSSLCPVVINK